MGASSSGVGPGDRHLRHRRRYDVWCVGRSNTAAVLAEHWLCALRQQSGQARPTVPPHPPFVPWLVPPPRPSVPDEFALCPPAQAMERWIRSRTEPLTNPDAGAGAGARKKKKARHGREAIANSAKAPEGSFCNALNIALTLRQRMAAVTCRQDERNSKFFDLRKKYVRAVPCGCITSPRTCHLPLPVAPETSQINLLRQNQAEHKVGYVV